MNVPASDFAAAACLTLDRVVSVDIAFALVSHIAVTDY